MNTVNVQRSGGTITLGVHHADGLLSIPITIDEARALAEALHIASATAENFLRPVARCVRCGLNYVDTEDGYDMCLGCLGKRNG